MKYAISLTPVIPVRENPSETSEMISQLLFGEHMSVLDEKESWIRICNAFDSYTGWIDRKMVTEISENDYELLSHVEPVLVKNPNTQIYKTDSDYPIRVSIGTVIPFYDTLSQSFKINDVRYFIKRNQVRIYEKESYLRPLLRTAELFINTSYLWGGRSIMGIDCSGFVQSVFRLNNINLPRDASQQYNEGELISFDEAYPGDLVFFKNDKGRVIHVGIFKDKDKIIHCSGDVHIDTLDSKGIFNHRLQKYTHFNPEIKRLAIKRRKK